MVKRFIELFAAGIDTMLIPVLAAIFGILDGPTWIGDRPDNAPYRAAWGLLVLSPFFLLMSICYWAVILRFPDTSEKLSMRSGLLPHLASSTCVAVTFAWGGFLRFGPLDGTISFWIFGGISMACLACGTIAWKLVQHVRLRTDRQVAASGGSSTER